MKFIKRCSIYSVMILFCFTMFYCATVKKIVKDFNDIAMDYCIHVMNQKDVEPDGMTIEDWCRIQRNVDYFVDILLAGKDGAPNP